MRKRVLTACMVMALGVSVTACGQKEPTPPETESSVAVSIEIEPTEQTKETEESAKESTAEETTAEETTAEETTAEETVAETVTEAAKETQKETTKQETAQQETEEASAGGYEDNFAVDKAAAEAFANEIKEAVANKDLEALAVLTGYPVYVGFAGGSATPTTREEFVALGADRIFTPELMESVANADVSGLEASRAGFVVSTGEGPNVIFGVRDGVLAINGYNY